MPSKYLKTDKKGFNSLLKKANELLGLPDGNGNDNYCSPLIDNGDYYFIVNNEIISLVDENKLIDFIKEENAL